MGEGRILFVDDEPQIRRVMRAALSRAGYLVVDAGNAGEALLRLRQETPHLILLDLNLPDAGGVETCRTIREISEVPIIVLSVRNSERDKVRALDAGADDYVTKPFSMDELLARIRAAMRRIPTSPNCGPRSVVCGDLAIDFESRRVMVRNAEIHLTPKEFDLLHYLVRHAGRPVRHRRLLQAVWGPDYGHEIEYLRVFINQLRRKIEPDAADPRYIITEPWVGYRFEKQEPPFANREPEERESLSDL
ncbi:MAG: response regulator transcription factor [Acidobacteria bacterium]|nr:response regulator transcription factor [Acidobacteriota bacterium]